MSYFSRMIELYMRVESLSRAQMAAIIGIPTTALRRLHEGKPIKSTEIIQVIDWMFDECGPDHADLLRHAERHYADAQQQDTDDE